MIGRQFMDGNTPTGFGPIPEDAMSSLR
jgi:hypothetical protein